jgi:hypothetical protein
MLGFRNKHPALVPVGVVSDAQAAAIDCGVHLVVNRGALRRHVLKILGFCESWGP